MLATILIFMDQQITAVIVNRREHLLKKGMSSDHSTWMCAFEQREGSVLVLIRFDQPFTLYRDFLFALGCGYHLDLLLVGGLIFVNSIFGLPWFVAATVLSITYVQSLRLESECAAPGGLAGW